MCNTSLDSLPVIFDAGVPVARATSHCKCICVRCIMHLRPFHCIMQKSTYPFHFLFVALSISFLFSTNFSKSCCNFRMVDRKSSPAVVKSPLDRVNSMSRLTCASSSLSSLTRVNDCRSSCYISVGFLFHDDVHVCQILCHRPLSR